MEFAGLERVTTDPAPTMQLSPIITPGRISERPPIKQF